MYEKITDDYLPKHRFATRMLLHAALVLALMAVSIGVGVIGLVFFEGKGLEEAILHAAYMLSGFGLIEVPTSFSGKLFIGLYGLYASVFFLASFSIIFAPIIHRILHKLHLD